MDTAGGSVVGLHTGTFCGGTFLDFRDAELAGLVIVQQEDGDHDEERSATRGRHDDHDSRILASCCEAGSVAGSDAGVDSDLGCDGDAGCGPEADADAAAGPERGTLFAC
eukprot:6342517-Prymnesium_polylepis.1